VLGRSDGGEYRFGRLGGPIRVGRRLLRGYLNWRPAGAVIFDGPVDGAGRTPCRRSVRGSRGGHGCRRGGIVAWTTTPGRRLAGIDRLRRDNRTGDARRIVAPPSDVRLPDRLRPGISPEVGGQIDAVALDAPDRLHHGLR